MTIATAISKSAQQMPPTAPIIIDLWLRPEVFFMLTTVNCGVGIEGWSERPLHVEGEKERHTWERFIAGYVAFHFLSPRYRLKELTGREYI